MDYLIRTLRVRQVQVIEKMLSEIGLALSAWYPLSLLVNGDGISQRELGLRLSLKDAAIGKAIESMEKAGLVVRRADAKDRRKILVYLTEKGRRTAQSVVQQRRLVISAMLKGLTKAEVAAFKNILKKSYSNLGKLLG